MSAIEDRARTVVGRSSSGTGLSCAEAARRLESDSLNALPVERQVRLWRRVLMQVRDPLVTVLLVAAALTIGTGDWTDAGVILLVIVVNTSVGVAQEVKADRAISALGALTAPHARVVRDGQQRQIASAEVIVGDLLVLGGGEIVPADALVVDAAALLVDEFALTGESVPVTRAPPRLPGNDYLLNKLALASPDFCTSRATVSMVRFDRVALFDGCSTAEWTLQTLLFSLLTPWLDRFHHRGAA